MLNRRLLDKRMMKIVSFLLFCHVACAVKHSLNFFFTVSSGLGNFPEYVAVAVVDGVQVGYCDSIIKRAEPKQDWVKTLMRDHPWFLDWYAEGCYGSHQLFKADLSSLTRRFNHTQGVHVFQRMTGCEWDDETGRVEGYAQYGYDGEDFLVFDMETLTWIAPTSKAVVIKHEWDRNTARNVDFENHVIHLYVDHLKRFLAYGKSALQRTVFPSLSLLQKSPSSPVSCHATGFYPANVVMFWRKDGEELHEGVDHGEILPNHDGTFQKSLHLDISSVRPEDWRRYECVFQISGIKEPNVTVLDPKMIRSNWGKTEDGGDGGPPAAAVIGVVVVLLLLAVTIAGGFIWRRNRHGFKLTNTSVTSSDEGSTPADDGLDGGSGDSTSETSRDTSL